MIFLLATRNPKKRQELQRLLKDFPVRLLTLDVFPDIPPVHENGTTFRANAVKKAVQTSRRTLFPVVADDSGLEVRALKGCPGVRSARFARVRAGQAGLGQNDAANNKKLLRLLRKTPISRRQARFVCWIAVAANGRLIRTFQGSCAGSVAFRPSGKQGFGYDPLFIPRGYKKTMAELGPGVKDRLSHRGKAMSALKTWLHNHSPFDSTVRPEALEG